MDSRDGLALYKSLDKTRKAAIVSKTKLRLVAVTPFAEALNPMAVKLIQWNKVSDDGGAGEVKSDETRMDIVMIDTKGNLKVFRVP